MTTKRDKKKKEREKRVKKRMSEVQRLTSYPEFIFAQENANALFIQQVISIVKKIDFDDREVFTCGERRLLKKTKKYGIQQVYRSDVDGFHFLRGNICNYIYSKLIEEGGHVYIPENIFCMLFIGNNIKIHFKAFNKTKINGSWVYMSPKNKINYNNKEYLLCYTKHTLERLWERCSPSGRKSYLGAVDANVMLSEMGHNGVEFNVCDIAPQKGHDYVVTMWASCMEQHFTKSYIRRLTGDNSVVASNYKYRVGYMPIDFVDDCALAKTLLLPGMRGTPEHVTTLDMLTKATTPDDQERFRDMLEPSTMGEMCEMELKNIRLFHDLGIEQFRVRNKYLPTAMTAQRYDKPPDVDIIL